MGEIVLGGRYVIENEIGAGGMAIVYKAHDRMLNRTVAIKVLRPEFKQDEEFIKRFDTEAKSAAGLNHPNIVAIYDVGIHEGLRYIVMEYVKGSTLKDVIRNNGKLPWEQALKFAKRICSALTHAHERKIIHRDIKPHNIMVTEDGSLKVMDFGIARATSASTMTMGAKVLGSAHYLSPEQARGGFTDERSDLYSLGVCLYEMVTGKVPFDAETTVAVAMQHLQKDAPSPKDSVPDLPPSVEHIILKAMRKEQTQRYLSALSMESDIIRALADPSVIPDSDGNDSFYSTRQIDIIEETDEKRPVKPKKKNDKKVIWLTTAGILVALALAFWLVFSIAFDKFSKDNDKVVPQLKGFTLEETEEIISEIDENIKVIVKKEIYSSKDEKGKVIEQEPEPEEKFPDNGCVYITIGKGPEYEVLRSFIGDRVEDAETDLTELGIKYVIENEDDDDLNEEYEEGRVTRQEPSAGENLRIESTIVTVYVSMGDGNVDPKLPDVVGKDIEEAKEILKGMKYKNISVTEEESDEKPGTVIRQEPEEDERLAVEKEILLVIAKEKAAADTNPRKCELKFTVPESYEEMVVVKVLNKNNGASVYRNNHMPAEEVTINVSLKANEIGRYEIYINDAFYKEMRVEG